MMFCACLTASLAGEHCLFQILFLVGLCLIFVNSPVLLLFEPVKKVQEDAAHDVACQFAARVQRAPQMVRYAGLCAQDGLVSAGHLQPSFA